MLTFVLHAEDLRFAERRAGKQGANWLPAMAGMPQSRQSMRDKYRAHCLLPSAQMSRPTQSNLRKSLCLYQVWLKIGGNPVIVSGSALQTFELGKCTN